MADDSRPMLFAPPQPPYALSETDPITLGRSSDCDLRLPDADTSRRHARIAYESGRFVVRDLASTNGTLVNGERIEQHPLVPGDRIQVGANTVTFCQVSVPVDEPDDGAQTVLFERPVAAPTEAFHGDLAEIPPFAVLQILEMGRKTGVLQLDATTAPGRIWLSGGDPFHAETKDQVGFDAALALVSVDAGRFTFEPLLDLPEKTIDASVTQLLLEASRLMDEVAG
jgi:pSer/pThr/pTyr-binding forkhead associated (FHA) protein